MRINDILSEDVASAEGSNDYQQMMAMVRGNQMPGVPPEQRVALALFKELKKQQQQNAALSSELDAAEQRIDQATQSGELQGQELGMHSSELARERERGAQQKADIGRLGKTYAEREAASQEQVSALAAKLEAVKNMPGVNKDSVERLEKQIKELSQTGIGADKVQELERSIAVIRSAESADDTAIKELVAQVNAAQAATKELQKTKQTVGADAEETAKRALDQVEQIKQQLAHFKEIEDATKLVKLQVNQLVKKQEVADKMSAANLPASTADMAKGAVSQGVNPLLTPQAPSPQMSLPGVDTPAPTSGSQIELPGLDQPETDSAMAKNIVGKFKQANTAEKGNIYESAFNRSVAWATGKTI